MVVDKFTIDADGYVQDAEVGRAIATFGGLVPADARLPIEIAYMLTRAYAALARSVVPVRAEFGLSGARYGVLRALYEAEKPELSMREIADSLTVPPPNITQLVI